MIIQQFTTEWRSKMLHNLLEHYDILLFDIHTVLNLLYIVTLSANTESYNIVANLYIISNKYVLEYKSYIIEPLKWIPDE